MPEFTNMNCFTCFYVGFNKSSWQERAQGDSQHLLSTSYVPGTLHAAFHLSLRAALQTHQLCPCLTDQETGTQKNNFSKVTHLVTELGVSSLRLHFFFFLSQKLPFYLFLAVLGPLCCADFSLVAESRGYSLVRCEGLLWWLLWWSSGCRGRAGFSSGDSLALEHRLTGCGSQHRL